MGRPSSYTDAVAMRICTRLANGESLRTICLDADMPDRGTVIYWLAQERNAEFARQYARAREAQADHYADEIIEISNTPVIGKKTKKTGKVTEVTTGDMIEHRRLQVDARKWYAEKVAPKKYGTRAALEHTGRDGKDLPATTTTVQAGVLVVPGVMQDPDAWTKLVKDNGQ